MWGVVAAVEKRRFYSSGDSVADHAADALALRGKLLAKYVFEYSYNTSYGSVSRPALLQYCPSNTDALPLPERGCNQLPGTSCHSLQCWNRRYEGRDQSQDPLRCQGCAKVLRRCLAERDSSGCCYHRGTLETPAYAAVPAGRDFQQRWSCCRGAVGAKGCQVTHISLLISPPTLPSPPYATPTADASVITVTIIITTSRAALLLTGRSTGATTRL